MCDYFFTLLKVDVLVSTLICVFCLFFFFFPFPFKPSRPKPAKRSEAKRSEAKRRPFNVTQFTFIHRRAPHTWRGAVCSWAVGQIALACGGGGGDDDDDDDDDDSTSMC